jgi:outer membrane lipoprotein-sorting protein
LAAAAGISGNAGGQVVEKTVSPLLSSLCAKYGPESTIRTEFDLSIFWKVREKTEHKSGILYLAPGDRFRLELGKNTWVSDGRSYWQYSAATSQVLIKQLLDIDISAHPSQIMSTYFNKYSYTMLENQDGQAVFSWQAQQADADSDNKSVTLWVDVKKLTLKKLLVVDKSGNESTYIFKKTAAGAEIPDAAFKFQIPDGVSVLDTRR